jgi:hypothetical protein
MGFSLPMDISQKYDEKNNTRLQNNCRNIPEQQLRYLLDVC